MDAQHLHAALTDLDGAIARLRAHRAVARTTTRKVTAAIEARSDAIYTKRSDGALTDDDEEQLNRLGEVSIPDGVDAVSCALDVLIEYRGSLVAAADAIVRLL
jgi:hypothetical protein